MTTVDPGSQPFYISRRRFEEIVAEALDEIPEALWKVIDNVVVTVEEWPTRRHIDRVGLGPGNTLLGLYEGVPLTVRTSHYGLVAPDKITIFRGPILQVSPADEDAVRAQIRQTVLHEIAHHFGISDERLIELGAY
ncbi:MAG: metallopeptidase family protein [Caldilinea sp.]|nr:metallopeptidase family protein [Caldilinea sp.]MCB0066825.1 metallopeptidase family protein [Caldilineaceae bacterium]MCB0054519.1 metallopeptidase family protein [Caldilinea sp.]MCB0134990.1 metallopeptidase family protein [Caldilineaceae bacterium]MCB0148498.1 metallopeptidase family protein [Caldilineaceae bacterium]